MKMLRSAALAVLLAAPIALGVAAPAMAQYKQEIGNDMGRCDGSHPAVRLTVTGISASSGSIRVQSYRGTAAEWLAKGRWLHRIQVPARRGTMTFCVPVAGPGTYAIAVRHDVNGNGETDIMTDGGGMSNNPSISIFNLGKPSVRQTAITVGDGVKAIQINMRYM
jgi:uncharacterized protein (DUF2141 family)